MAEARPTYEELRREVDFLRLRDAGTKTWLGALRSDATPAERTVSHLLWYAALRLQDQDEPTGLTVDYLALTDQGLVTIADRLEPPSVVGPLGPSPSARRVFDQIRNQVLPLEPTSVQGRAVLERRTIAIGDLLSAEGDDYPVTQARAALTQEAVGRGIHSFIASPAMAADELFGVLAFRRNFIRPFTASEIELVEDTAEQIAAALSGERAAKRLEEGNRQLTEALAQQTAMAEVLGIISRSATDAQPVLDAIVERAANLTGAADSNMFFRQGGLARQVARTRSGSLTAIPDATPVERRRVVGRAILDGVPQNFAGDLASWEAEYPGTAGVVGEIGFDRWSAAVVPLIRNGDVMGCLAVNRLDLTPFDPTAVALLEAFADQAVIAIENARLFNELQAANASLMASLEQKTATANILAAIANSPGSLTPVLQTVVEAAASLSGDYQIYVGRRSGEFMEMLAGAGPGVSERARKGMPRFSSYQFHPQHTAAAAMIEGRPVRWAGLDDLKTRFPITFETHLQEGSPHRAGLTVPLMRHGEAFGCLIVRRLEERPFTDEEVAVMQTFADQAVIAIENARLFNELEERNREVSQALEQQTAMSEVLSIIASSPANLQPVLDAIVQRAANLCRSRDVHIVRSHPDGYAVMIAYFGPDRLRLPQRVIVDQNDANVGTYVINHGVPNRWTGRDELRRRFPVTADFYDRPGAPPIQAGMAIPLSLNNEVIGMLGFRREEPIAYTDGELELMESFADQAVIAIENARLFNELEDRNREVSEALDVQTAMAELLRIIASSPADVQPVLDAIVRKARALCPSDAALIVRRTPDEFMEAIAYAGDEPHPPLPFRTPFAYRRDNLASKVIIDGVPERVTGLEDLARRFPYTDEVQRTSGERRPLSTMYVPLLLNGSAFGCLGLRRFAEIPFTDEDLALVTAFADQAVIAIENARLFNELQETNEALDLASRHKSEFLASMSHELRTPLNAIIGYSELLTEEAEDLGDDAYIPDLAKINQAAKHQLMLINDILDLSKVEAGRMTIFVEEFDIAGLLDGVKSMVTPLVEKNGNVLVVECPSDAGAMTADMTKVRQALFNLLSNAAKFTEHGTITLSVRAARGFRRLRRHRYRHWHVGRADGPPL